MTQCASVPGDILAVDWETTRPAPTRATRRRTRSLRPSSGCARTTGSSCTATPISGSTTTRRPPVATACGSRTTRARAGPGSSTRGSSISTRTARATTGTSTTARPRSFTTGRAGCCRTTTPGCPPASRPTTPRPGQANGPHASVRGRSTGPDQVGPPPSESAAPGTTQSRRTAPRTSTRGRSVCPARAVRSTAPARRNPPGSTGTGARTGATVARPARGRRARPRRRDDVRRPPYVCRFTYGGRVTVLWGAFAGPIRIPGSHRLTRAARGQLVADVGPDRVARSLIFFVIEGIPSLRAMAEGPHRFTAF
ncbi:hypothetical protein HGI10_66870 [Streptomyces collinus]|nr:hypothetical protein HGI10_66870 [Streptomyces collinus]